MTQEPPPHVVAAAERRSAARAERDFATADSLRAEIEAAGWKVVDAGVAYHLEAAHPPTVVADGVIRYGRSHEVPSRLDEPPTRPASVILVSREDPAATSSAARAVLGSTSAETQVVVVVDGPDAEPDLGTDRGEGSAPEAGSQDAADRIELVRTSAVLGQGAALNAGLRRAAGSVVVVLDASVEPVGDWLTRLIGALEDPGVAVAGPLGLVTSDLRHFDEVDHGDAAAIEGYLQVFRRADAIARGPLDEGFRFYRNLDIWWSLVLRDEGEGRRPRTARVVEGLTIRRGEPAAWIATPPAERDRLSKRNFYRVLDRFRDRLDLAVPAGS